MGGSKRMMEEEEQKRLVALQISIDAGVLKQCKIHDECIYEGSKEVESAYKLANFRVSQGELENVFENRKEMTDLIKEVVEEHGADECYVCAKNRDN